MKSLQSGFNVSFLFNLQYFNRYESTPYYKLLALDRNAYIFTNYRPRVKANKNVLSIKILLTDMDKASVKVGPNESFY
jgi:hypothetical protein